MGKWFDPFTTQIYVYFRTDEPCEASETTETTEDDTEDDDKPTKTHWHQRLLKSASGVFHRDVMDHNSPETRQCVLSTQYTPGGLEAEAEDHTFSCCENNDLETSISTSVSTSNNNNILLSTQIIMTLSIMLILHAMMANLWYDIYFLNFFFLWIFVHYTKS